MPNWKKVIVSGSDAHLNTLELTNTTTNDSILVTSTDAGSSAAPVITLKRNSGSPADSDYLGQIKFKGENAADQEVVYSKISGKIQDKADSTEDGIIEFSNIRSGSQVITARLKSDRLQLLNSTSLEVDGNIDIPDDAFLNIGDADDLQLYHDGSNSYIKDNGTGTIFYRSGTQTFQNAAGSKTMAVFNAANSVDLNYNNSTKLQTTNTGISVTGEGVFTGNISGSSVSSSGDILADGDVVAFNSSDMRLKNNLQVIEGALDKIDGINGYEFDWNDKSPSWARERGHDVGVVAQEVQKIHPEIVEERKNGYLGVDYKRLVPLLIQSIKELKDEVDEIKQKCDCLNK
tara:strand:+ start:380 stop:1417 length:1038 start_codon:yes stop_codon:yes gene_type:complete